MKSGLKVGITVFVAGVLCYWGITKLSKSAFNSGDEGIELHAYFHDATLLVDKSRVQIAGLTVGKIVGKSLDTSPPRASLASSRRYARITLAIDNATPIFENAIVYKRAASLLGEYYLDIDPGSATIMSPEGTVIQAKRLLNGDEILNVVEPVTPSGMIQEVTSIIPLVRGLIDQMTQLAEGPLTDISININKAVADNQGALNSIMNDLQHISGEVRSIAHSGGGQVSRILHDIGDVTASIKSTLNAGNGDLAKERGEQLDTALSKIDSSLRHLEKASEHAESITSTIDSGEGTVGRLLNDDQLIDDVESIVTGAGGLVGSIANLQTFIGLRSEYNFQADSIKTYVSVELRPRPDKFFFLELVDDPRGNRNRSTLISRSTDPAVPPLVREDRVEVSDAFRFSFQLAKRFNFAVFRFGVKESTGGIGLDLKFFSDRLQIWNDLFDLQSGPLPRIKVGAAWKFFEHLYIVGGVDDALNGSQIDGISQGRDFYLGAQFRFNDQDLRGLLLVGGGALGSLKSN